MDNELIKKARQANLAQYLISVGVPLVRNGHRYRHKEHDSLIFTENTYYWNSRQEHGNTIDYLVRHMGMDFVGAVLALTYAKGLDSVPPVKPARKFELNQAEINHNSDKARAYLNKTRKISHNIIDYLITNKLLYQEKRTNNIIFLIYDENNYCVGAELQGVTPKRFKGIMKNSKYGYGFNIRISGGDTDTFDYALFFESAVDLISFMDYKQNHENKSLERCILISMAGLKMNVIKHTLKAFNIARAVLCVDNDEAGQIFKDKLQSAEIHFIDRSPDSVYKDWSEQLIDAKQQSKPIQRLLSRVANNQQL